MLNPCDVLCYNSISSDIECESACFTDPMSWLRVSVSQFDGRRVTRWRWQWWHPVNRGWMTTNYTIAWARSLFFLLSAFLYRETNVAVPCRLDHHWAFQCDGRLTIIRYYRCIAVFYLKFVIARQFVSYLWFAYLSGYDVLSSPNVLSLRT